MRDTASSARRSGRVPRHAMFEHVEADRLASFVWRRDNYPWKRNVWNVHPEYEIHLIRNATGVALIGDYIGWFEPGHLAVVGGGLPHDWVTEIRPDEIIEGRDIVLQFDPDRLRRASVAMPELHNIEPFLQRALRGLVFHGETRRVGAELMEAIGNASGLERLSLFLRLLHVLAQSSDHDVLSSPHFLAPVDQGALDKVQLALSFLFRNFTSDAKLEDVARLVGMSDSHFSRFFKKNTGNSFSEHLARLRIGRACELLTNTDLAISDICFEVGYRNLSNFNRKFRTQQGITPSAYRRLAVARSGSPTTAGNCTSY